MELILNNAEKVDSVEVHYNNDRDLKMLLDIYGDRIRFVKRDDSLLNEREINELTETFEWSYLKPEEAYFLIKSVPLPLDIQHEMESLTDSLSDKLVHKNFQENVLLSSYKRFGKSIIFRAYDNWKELNSDHSSDHVDGIKIFEVIRQATLAAFHINNLQYDSSTALTNLKIEYLNYVEEFAPFIVQVIPVNKEDGGAMFTLFAVYQFGKLASCGYLGAYTFRSKEIFENKRSQTKKGARDFAESNHWSTQKQATERL